MVTMQSWMFLSSFEKMREKLLNTKTITCLMHMENMVMGIAFGTAVTVFRNENINGYKGTYNQIKLQDIDNNQPVEFPIRNNRFAQTSADNFAKIPGSPVAYWVSEKFIEAFEKRMDTTFMHPKLKRKVTYRTAIKLDCYKLIKYILEDQEFVPFSLKEGV